MAEKITKEIKEKLNEHRKNCIEVCGLSVTIGRDGMSVACYENQLGMALAILTVEDDSEKMQSKIEGILSDAAEKLNSVFSNAKLEIKYYFADASELDNDE